MNELKKHAITEQQKLSLENLSTSL